ncbi:DUF6602 domain-containing protein [Nocardioides dubius]|uniref:DUF6602 domain-containing protein n=1 Tax=Nocardioides dubius TaxID=317019 RepID=A0ABN1U3Y5_9ACTN
MQSVADGIQRDYEQAKEYARRRDPQRAGHHAEATWVQLIDRWGAGWPVVKRRYIVGPWGETGEVDLIVLRPDYPSALRHESDVLVSGVAAAFSCKSTLRSPDIADAIEQKRRIIAAGGGLRGRDAEEAMHAGIHFGLLAHGSAIGNSATSASESLQRLYFQVAHGGPQPAVTHPAEELDCLLVADSTFITTSRTSAAPLVEGGEVRFSPVTSPMLHKTRGHVGAPVAQFMAWVNGLSTRDYARQALASLEEMFGDETASGPMRVWPSSVLPPF